MWRAHTLPNYCTCPSCGQLFYTANAKERPVLVPRRGRADSVPASQPATSNHPDAPAAPAEVEPAPKTSAKPTADLSPDESRLFAGLNSLRASRGKPPVEVDPALEQVAREQLSDPRYTPHHSPRYGSSAQHAARYAKFTSVNDVVSAGQWSDGSRCTPEQSCDAWRQSPGHLRCILGQSNINDRWIDEGYDRVGVARGPKFDLAVFGRRAESNHRESTAAVQRGAIVVVAPLSTPCITRFADSEHEPSFTEAGVILRKVKANAGNLNVANDGQPHMLANTRRTGEVDAMSHRRILPDKKCECQSGGVCTCGPGKCNCKRKQ